MKRRSFLKLLGISAAIPSALLAETRPVLDVPKVAEKVTEVANGNRLLTPEEITREALRILEEKTEFIGAIDFRAGDQWPDKMGGKLKVRTPNNYTRSIG